MIEVVDTNINSFASKLEQSDSVPSLEPSITLTSSQLRDIIASAVKEAIEPLQEHIETLEAKISALQKEHDHLSENQFIQLQLINNLREEVHKEPEATATETERIERIEDLCTKAPGHTISLSELRGRLGIDKSVLSRLLKKIDRDRFYLMKSTTDKRIRYLCLRPVVR